MDSMDVDTQTQCAESELVLLQQLMCGLAEPYSFLVWWNLNHLYTSVDHRHIGGSTELRQRLPEYTSGRCNR